MSFFADLYRQEATATMYGLVPHRVFHFHPVDVFRFQPLLTVRRHRCDPMGMIGSAVCQASSAMSLHITVPI